MMLRRTAAVVGGLLFLAAVAWGMTIALDRLLAEPPVPAEPVPAAAPATPVAHITATLFVAAEDGVSLQPVRREVPFADGVVAQGRQILEQQLQLQSPADGVVPPGTRLRSFFVAERGDAFVDLSREASAAHAGGTLAELLTVQAVVQAVTSNLTAVHRVQVLVEGQTVDTLAGHVDLRRPLVPDPAVLASARAR
jgi:hypothetical protein